jgi:hypothetical protein
VRRTQATLVTLTLIMALPGRAVRAASADDFWPAWRGPRASGVSPKGQPPLHWSETQNVRWKVPVPGESTSSPIVWADKIFFLAAVETDRQGTPEEPPAQSTEVPFHGGKPPKNFYKFDVVCLDRGTQSGARLCLLFPRHRRHACLGRLRLARRPLLQSRRRA